MTTKELIEKREKRVTDPSEYEDNDSDIGFCAGILYCLADLKSLPATTVDVKEIMEHNGRKYKLIR